MPFVAFINCTGLPHLAIQIPLRDEPIVLQNLSLIYICSLFMGNFLGVNMEVCTNVI